MSSRTNINILICVTGSIAAYKTAEITRLLIKQGANVKVVMSSSAQKFITPLTFHSLSGNPVMCDIWDAEHQSGMGHIELARWANLILVAPASANFMANYASGVARDLLLSILLATTAKVIIAPAMNQKMYNSQSTIDNISTLQQRNNCILFPGDGSQACGDIGSGRLQEPAQIVAAINILHAIYKLPKIPNLTNKKFLISAGGTKEPIDAVRYITNESSGKMGVAIANVAALLGANVTLIAGNLSQDALGALQPNITLQRAYCAKEMFESIHKLMPRIDYYIGAAAISDWFVKHPSQSKDKKKHQPTDTLNVLLTKTPDIIASLSDTFPQSKIIGFAAETEKLIENAKQKLIDKKLHMIVANNVTATNNVFSSDFNQLHIITPMKEEFKHIELEKTSKMQAAVLLLDQIHQQL